LGISSITTIRWLGDALDNSDLTIDGNATCFSSGPAAGRRLHSNNYTDDELLGIRRLYRI